MPVQNNTFRNKKVQITVQTNVVSAVKACTPSIVHCPVLKTPASPSRVEYSGSRNSPVKKNKRTNDVLIKYVRRNDDER